jgi:hypothetical protein
MNDDDVREEYGEDLDGSIAIDTSGRRRCGRAVATNTTTSDDCGMSRRRRRGDDI